MAVFSASGKMPESIDVLTMLRMSPITLSNTSLRKGVGIVSSGQEVDVICNMVLRSSSSSILQNEIRLPLDLSTLFSRAFELDFIVMPARMFEILFSKNDANSLHLAFEAGSDCL